MDGARSSGPKSLPRVPALRAWKRLSPIVAGSAVWFLMRCWIEKPVAPLLVNDKIFKDNELHTYKAEYIGESKEMKKSLAVAFSMICLCGLMMFPAVVNAINSAYTYTDYETSGTHVEDGKWTTTSEWTDAMAIPNLVVGLSWRATWTWPSDILQHFIIEVYTDNTNSTGDIVNVCYDTAANGGAAPQSDDIKVELVGDRNSGLSVYKGNGTGWAKFTGWTASDVAVGVSFSSSPENSNSHLIVEFLVDKNTVADVSGSGYAPGIYLSAYDANNSAAGVKSWPPAPAASANVPDSWGLETGTTTAVPESLTIGAVVLLSSVVVAVSFYFLPKQPKLRITAQGK